MGKRKASKKPLCEKIHPNLTNVKCGRVLSDLDGDGTMGHVGPCARFVTLEWEYNENGRLKRSAVVDGRVDDLELKYGGPVQINVAEEARGETEESNG